MAHFHYVLIGGALFPLFGGFHYWFPKFTGRLMDERLGKLSFWILFVGFNLTFFPMHWLGVLGMTRRIYTYIPGLGWGERQSYGHRRRLCHPAGRARLYRQCASQPQ
ncbi:MAG: cbb3-type cytochrome c oxidase subunit I [Ignavibacteriota bacterium]